MKATAKGKKRRFFERLKIALEEGVRFARGEMPLRVTDVFEQPRPWKASDVVELRHKLRMTRRAFAHVVNVSPRTVQLWEEGARKPTSSALRLLQVMNAHPEIVLDSFAAT